MEYRRLGKTNLKISAISLGAWSFGSKNFWGEVSERDITEVIKKSVDKGINLIDTAIGYGDSEILIGKAIKNLRGKVIIATKGGADPKRIPKYADLSLKRLGLDFIDLYQVHYPDSSIPIEDTIGAMADLKRKGKIRYIGVSNFNINQLNKAISVEEIVSSQPAYNLMWREDEVLNFCYKNNIGVLAYSSLGQGLFTVKFRKFDDIPKKEGEVRQLNLLFKKDNFKDGLKIVGILRNLAKKYKKTIAQISINWVMNQRGITSAIVGAKNIKQLSDNINAVGWKMEEEDYELLINAGAKASNKFDYSLNM